MTPKIPEEFLPVDGPGRRFVTERIVRLGDVDPANQLRFDAIGRYAQDLANDDALDAGLEESLNFVVRKTVVVIETPPTFRERLSCTTFCNGVGGRWAGRQSVFVGSDGGRVNVSAVWVHVDPDSGRPKKLSDIFYDHYSESAQGRKASIKLAHDQTAPANAAMVSWPFRWADLDLLGHVNNAAYWRPIEQLLSDHGMSRAGMSVELEYRNPTPPDTIASVSFQLEGSLLSIWIIDDQTETTLATARVRID